MRQPNKPKNMFVEEAQWIAECLQSLSLTSDDHIGNIGSSNEVFRKQIQPHIHQEIFAPLEYKQIPVVHIDQKLDEGIDLVADVTVPFAHTHLNNQFSVLLCNNLLEHVTDINLVCKNLVQWCTANGYLLLTVPYKYPKHEDPIDNMFRPTPTEIVGLFVNVDIAVIHQKVITINRIENYPIKKSAYPIWGYRNRIKYFFGFRYKVSGVLIKLMQK